MNKLYNVLSPKALTEVLMELFIPREEKTAPGAHKERRISAAK